MRRRVVLALTLLCLALVATAVVPWTVSSSRLTAAVAEHLRGVYGLDFAVGGRSTIAFLPAPRLKFEDISLAVQDGTPIVRGGQLRGELRILPLLIGRLELAEVALNGSRIDLALGGSWDGLFALLRGQIEGRTARDQHLRRLVVTNSHLVARDREPAAANDAGDEALVRDINVVANWPNPDAAFDLTGFFSWRGETVSVSVTDARPSALLAGRNSRFALQAATPTTRLSLSGDVTLGDDPRVVGRSSFESRSLRNVLRWTGLNVPLGPLVSALSVEGDFTAERRAIAWPAIRIALGPDRLDGALSARFEGSRPVVTGTLAAERLDLSDYFAPLAQARTDDGAWSTDAFDLARFTGGDLDVRISATAGRIGAWRLQDMGASVLVRPGRIEASLGRASLHNGTVKGRLAIVAPASENEGVEMRLQSAFERVDLAALTTDLNRPRWIGGAAQGAVALEGAGVSPADLVRQLKGKASVTVRQGELYGVAFADALRRIERRPLSAPFEWRGGRTPFDQAHLSLAVTNGIGEIVDGLFTAQNLRGVLQGRVSFLDRTVSAQASVDATAPTAVQQNGTGQARGAAGNTTGMAFNLLGPWEDVSFGPDARALIQRSGAAQPLLPPDVRLSLDRDLNTPTPSATAQ